MTSVRQSRLASFAETVANTAIGFLVTLGANYVIFPAYDVKLTFNQNIQIVFWFTLLSVARGYVVRRMWNAEWWKHLFNKGTNHGNACPPHQHRSEETHP